MVSPRCRSMDAPRPAPFRSGLHPFAFGAARRFGCVPSVARLEAEGWSKVGAVLAVPPVWVMRHDPAD